jgi:predicted phosphodiesterase
MLSDFDVIVRRFDSAIKIACISDVHYGAIGHMEKEWKKFIKMVQDDPNLYLILGGDLINNNTRSSVGSPWDDIIRPRDQKIHMVEMLTPIKDRILCCVSGNHERRSLKDADDDVMYDIMTKLDLEDVYRQNAAFMKIQLGYEKALKNRHHTTYMFAVTHGSGGGQTGSAVNRNERWGSNIDGVDCVVSGHTHKGAVSKPMKMVFDPYNNKILFKQFVSVICVSWQKYVDFPIQKMMNPSAVSDPQFLYLSDKTKNIEVRW